MSDPTVWWAGGKPIHAWTGDMEVCPKARLQLEETSRMPFIHKHIAVMPDVHLGIGATVGRLFVGKAGNSFKRRFGFAFQIFFGEVHSSL